MYPRAGYLAIRLIWKVKRWHRELFRFYWKTKIARQTPRFQRKRLTLIRKWQREGTCGCRTDPRRTVGQTGNRSE